MADNKPSELQAESLVIHELLKYGIKTTKPLFDEEGTDLLIIDQVSFRTAHVIKVQCKYRSYGSSKQNRVSIPTSYVSENFVLFLYVINEDKKDGLYVFFADDLKKWKIYNSDYSFGISIATLEEQKGKLFDIVAAETIKRKLKEVDVKKYTSIIIDGIFLEKAIQMTKLLY
ncbi:MAG: hypothetical protein EOO35_00920, partial [Cyanobacteriota bacterium]